MSLLIHRDLVYGYDWCLRRIMYSAPPVTVCVVDNHDSVPRRTSQHDSDPLTDPKLNWPSQLEGHHEGIYAYDLDILNNLGILVRALRHF